MTVQHHLEPYQPYIQSPKEAKALRFFFTEGKRISCFLDFLLTSDYKLGQITLTFCTDTVTIQGKHLDQLFDLLAQHRIAILYQWNPDKHLPPEDRQPVITHITSTAMDKYAVDPQEVAMRNRRKRRYKEIQESNVVEL